MGVVKNTPHSHDLGMRHIYLEWRDTIVDFFEKEHNRWLIMHKKQRKGESLRRLSEGHGHGEVQFLKEVWWPAFGNLDCLHPEYEVRDFGGGVRYLDFAYLRGLLRIALEVDGFGPHCRDINRNVFSRNLQRQNMLIIDDYKVLRFSYDDITENPRMCQQAIQQLIGKYMISDNKSIQLDPYEKEIIRVAVARAGCVRPKEISTGCTLP